MRKEIMKAASEYSCESIPYDSKTDAFVAGAEWMQKKMIEKACEWIKKRTYQDCLGVSPMAKLKVGFSSVEELINELTKAMEE